MERRRRRVRHDLAHRGGVRDMAGGHDTRVSVRTGARRARNRASHRRLRSTAGAPSAAGHARHDRGPPPDRGVRDLAANSAGPPRGCGGPAHDAFRIRGAARDTRRSGSSALGAFDPDDPGCFHLCPYRTSDDGTRAARDNTGCAHTDQCDSPDRAGPDAPRPRKPLRIAPTSCARATTCGASQGRTLLAQAAPPHPTRPSRAIGSA